MADRKYNYRGKNEGDYVKGFSDGKPVYGSRDNSKRRDGENDRRNFRSNYRYDRSDRDNGDWDNRGNRDYRGRDDLRSRDGEERENRFNRYERENRYDRDKKDREYRASDRDGRNNRERNGGNREEYRDNRGERAERFGRDRRDDRDNRREGSRDAFHRSDDNRERRFDSERRRSFDRGEKKRESFEGYTENRFTRRSESEEENESVELPNIIMGRNPVKEAIKSGRSIDRILVTKEHDGSLNEILDLARDAKLVIRDVERTRLDELCMPFGHNGRTGNHQGIVAEIPGVEYCELTDILDYANEKGEAPFVILLDGIEDPHNLGSIIRSAECAGAHGVVITKRRSASVTAAVMKTSAGATEYMKIAKVVNLSVAIDRLKAAGVWVYGADMQGESVYKTSLKGAVALCIGAEGSGISRLVKEKCDYLVSVPLNGKLDSLNASVAAAVVMFEKVRQEKA